MKQDCGKFRTLQHSYLCVFIPNRIRHHQRFVLLSAGLLSTFIEDVLGYSGKKRKTG